VCHHQASRQEHENIYRNSVLEISVFYVKNKLKVYIKCVMIFSNYKILKDIQKNCITVFKN
jgi:hypothetical protein